MSNPASHPGRPVAHAAGRSLSVPELLVVLEELDRVVAELQESLTEIALPMDDASRCAARDAIAAARRH